MPPQNVTGMPSSNHGAVLETVLEAEGNPNLLADTILNQSWWDTGDAIRCFGTTDGEASPKESLVDIVSQLQNDTQQELVGNLWVILSTSRTCVRCMQFLIFN
jgi:hypothetical protein